MSNYSLQSYEGVATRHTCPSCGDRHSFAYYVDEQNTPLHPSVGRCNHESSRGYHYTPKQYFLGHPECRTANDFSFDRQRVEQKHKQLIQPTAVGYISQDYVEKSQSVHSNFFRFISTLLTSYYGSKAREMLNRLLEEYCLGVTRDGAFIFWQIDHNNKVRTGKVMQYNPEDGHRVKGGQASAVNWIHSILKKQRVLPRGMATVLVPLWGTSIKWQSRQGGGLGGIRKECRHQICHLYQLCVVGDRRQEPDERGKNPYTE